jgi:probable H4MPT-linked C1 transfer pathway protein
LLSIGLDVGGANTKVVVCTSEDKGEVNPGDLSLEITSAESSYFPFWQELDGFPKFLSALLEARLSLPHATGATMTAELADCFATKREGVEFILSSIAELDPAALVLLNSGMTVSIKKGLASPLEVAAGNWAAPAMLLGTLLPECIFIDVGSTTTDIIPISGSRPKVSNPTDTGRLQNGELVYTGALRTNVATVVDEIVLDGHPTPLASELFATTGDVNLLLGLIAQEDYKVPTSDGGEATREGAMRRLARTVCSDLESLSPAEITQMAQQMYTAQVSKVARSIEGIMSRQGFDADVPCIVAGIGRPSLAEPAARAAGLRTTTPFHDHLQSFLDVRYAGRDEDVSIMAPAASLSLLLAMGRVSCG